MSFSKITIIKAIGWLAEDITESFNNVRCFSEDRWSSESLYKNEDENLIVLADKWFGSPMPPVVYYSQYYDNVGVAGSQILAVLRILRRLEKLESKVILTDTALLWRFGNLSEKIVDVCSGLMNSRSKVSTIDSSERRILFNIREAINEWKYFEGRAEVVVLLNDLLPTFLDSDVLQLSERRPATIATEVPRFSQ